MCTYCYCGDQFSKWDPPYPEWHKQSPLIPAPMPQVVPNIWPLDKAKEYLEILKQIKSLEDQLTCACEPNKADYIALLGQLVKKLEAQNAGKQA